MMHNILVHTIDIKEFSNNAQMYIGSHVNDIPKSLTQETFMKHLHFTRNISTLQLYQ